MRYRPMPSAPWLMALSILVGQLDVGREAHADAVLGLAGEVAILEQLLLERGQAPRSPAVLLHHLGAGVDDDLAVAIDDDQVAGADLGHHALDADHGRDVEGARQDRGVRGLAALLGHDGRDGGAAQAGDVGRRQPVRDHDGVGRRRQVNLDLAGQAAHDALDDPGDVLPARAQVVVLDGGEDLADVLRGLLQRPLGVDAIRGDAPHRLHEPGARRAG